MGTVYTPSEAIIAIKSVILPSNGFHIATPKKLEALLQSTSSVKWIRQEKDFPEVQTGYFKELFPSPYHRWRHVFLSDDGKNVAREFYLFLAKDIAVWVKDTYDIDVYAVGSIATNQSTFPISKYLQIPSEYTGDPNKIDPISDMDLIVRGIDLSNFEKVHSKLENRLHYIGNLIPEIIRFAVNLSSISYDDGIERNRPIQRLLE